MLVKPDAHAAIQMVKLQPGNHPFRNQADQRQIHAADEGQARENPADVLGGVAPRTYAGNKPAMLAHVVGQLGRIEYDAHVKKGKTNNQRYIEQRIQRLAPADGAENILGALRLGLEQQRQGLRNGQQGARKNRRDHAAGVDAQRQIGHLPAHHAPPHHALGILHGDAPLAALHQDDEGHHRHHHHQQDDYGDGRKISPVVIHYFARQIFDSSGQAHYDAGKNNQRHAVADTALADLLAEPHDEGGAGGQGEDGHQHEADAGVVNQRSRAARGIHGLLHQREGDGHGLEDGQAYGEVAGVLGNFAAAQLAFLLQTLQVRKHHGHQLQNNRRGDVGHDAQRENRQPAEISAAEQIQNAQHGPAPLLEELLQQLGVDPRRGNKRAQPVDGQEPERKQQPAAKIRYPENIRNRVEEAVHS